MKIGFDFALLNINISRPDSGMLKRVGKLFSILEDSGHELFVFYLSDMSVNSAIRCKKSFLKTCSKANVPTFRFSVISENDILSAGERSHIDIFITADKINSKQLSDFTDSICGVNMSFESLLKAIEEIVQKNREPLISADSEPSGLPSKDRLWLKYYRVGDLKWNGEKMSPYDRLIISNKDWLDEIAMEFFGKKFSYGAFFRRIENISDIMYADGIRKGMRVPLVFVNTPESIIVLYALYRLKATVVPIFPLSVKEDMSNKLESICRQNRANGFDSTKMFMSDLVFGRFWEIIPDDVKMIVLDITDSMPKLISFTFKHIIAPKMGVKPVMLSERVISFKDYSARKAPHIDVDTSFDNSYTAVQLYTGGTVKPKSVLLSEENIDCASKQFYNDRFAFRRGDKIAAFMPLNHSFGLIIGTHVALTLGVDLDIIMKINFKRLDKLFLKDKVNLFGGIPNMFPAIRNNTHFKNADLSHVKYILSGGSLIDNTEKERTTAFFKAHNSQAEVHDGYGLTESAGGIIYDGIPNIGIDVKIVESGTEYELGYDELGELCMSGAQIMCGYDEAELSKDVLKHHSDGKLWLHTGDNAVIHRDGKIEVIGRMDRMIKVNGEQVILDDIEEIINTLSFVEKSAVVKRADSKRGFVPVAFIKLKPGSKWGDNEKEAVSRIYDEKLATYAHPRETIEINELPITAVGKIDINALEKLAEKEKIKTTLPQ